LVIGLSVMDRKLKLHIGYATTVPNMPVVMLFDLVLHRKNFIG
jgi:hypothetical protein